MTDKQFILLIRTLNFGFYCVVNALVRTAVEGDSSHIKRVDVPDIEDTAAIEACKKAP